MDLLDDEEAVKALELLMSRYELDDILEAYQNSILLSSYSDSY